jgi:hypothetical protein
MPQSLANVLPHLVFSTKNWAPLLKSKGLRESLNAYMVGTLQNIECPSLITRSVEDHLHCLCCCDGTKLNLTNDMCGIEELCPVGA